VLPFWYFENDLATGAFFFYYYLENFGVLKCFIAFLEEFCSPPFRKCHSRQCSMTTREILGQHWSVYYKVLLTHKYFKHCAVSINK